MHSLKQTARVAGVLYLGVTITGILGLIVLPAKLLVPGNAAASAARILESEPLYRLYMLDGLVASILFLFVAVALYRLLRDVSSQYAALMVVLVLVMTPLGILDTMNQLRALDLLHGGSLWSAIDRPQREALAMSLLDPDGRGTSAVMMLWGLWLFPLAVLVFRSEFLPRFLGVWLWINGLAYVVMSFTGLLWPQYSSTLKTVLFPAHLGELVLALWLVIVGARPKRVPELVLVSP